jgi:hypothetical protein
MRLTGGSMSGAGVNILTNKQNMIGTVWSYVPDEMRSR